MSRLRAAWDALTGRTEARSILSTDPRLEALMGGLVLTGGQIVNPTTAQNLSTVLACVSAIGGGLASLPFWVYRRTDRGREVDDGHALMRLHRQGVNRWQSWPDFIEWLLASTLLAGNGLAEIVTDGRGRLVELRPVPWQWSAVQLLPSGRIAYDVTEQQGMFGTTGRTRRLLDDEVLHTRDRSDDGILGISRLRRAAAVVGGSQAIQEFASSSLSNGVFPAGTIQGDGQMTAEQREHLRDQFKKFAGVGNAGKALILDQGLKWQSMTISPEDQELLGTRRFAVEELARLYAVPPPIIGDLTHGTFTNTETLVRHFAATTLAQWSRKLEAAIAQQVFTADQRMTHEVEFDLSGLLRGDPAERWQSHRIATEAGILTANEVREIEGWDPRPDGDHLAAPLAMPSKPNGAMTNGATDDMSATA